VRSFASRKSIGFVFDRQRGSHAVYYRAADKRRVVIPIHGSKDLKLGTLRGIINDMGLTIDEFTAKL
jgi:predicted RNA binding protein YcfA (HicA-like mRNA interferase family)